MSSLLQFHHASPPPKYKQYPDAAAAAEHRLNYMQPPKSLPLRAPAYDVTDDGGRDRYEPRYQNEASISNSKRPTTVNEKLKNPRYPGIHLPERSAVNDVAF